MPNDEETRAQAIPMDEYKAAYQPPIVPHSAKVPTRQAIPQGEMRHRISRRRMIRRMGEATVIATGVLALGATAIAAEEGLQSLRPEDERTSKDSQGNARRYTLRGLMGKALEPFANVAKLANNSLNNVDTAKEDDFAARMARQKQLTNIGR